MAKKETNTKSFILRIDSETMSAIEAWAEDEFRSTNGQLQWIIAEALRKAGRLPKKKKAASKKSKEEDATRILVHLIWLDVLVTTGKESTMHRSHHHDLLGRIHQLQLRHGDVDAAF